jgi:hypothetical protein
MARPRKKYLVLVHGRNFGLAWQERRRSVTKITGFYTTRCVVAADPADAERQAIELIHTDSKLRRSVRNSSTDPPLMFVNEIREVDSFAPLRAPGSGYAFVHGRGAGRPRAERRR